MNLQEWKKRNWKAKKYAHFDARKNLSQVWYYISDKRNIVKHGFYPFIHYTQKHRRYNCKKKSHTKEREIAYAAHVDRYIYSYYGFMLNELYMKELQKQNLMDVPLAYRTDLGQNNIHFAKKAFDFILMNEPCYVVIGDFHHFFDNLDHKYLKKQICTVLGQKSLPDDYYAVFKNITYYSTWELNDLLELNNLKKGQSGIKTLNEKECVLSNEEFKKLKHKYVKSHNLDFGIPQGSPISAVLSNIYMLEFDKKLNEYVQKNYGKYMRYCDDFVVIFPEKKGSDFCEEINFIRNLVKETDGLELQDEKTQIYLYENEMVQNISSTYVKTTNVKNTIDYLGFSFDGRAITIRDKTISKYYYRMYRKAKHIVASKGITKNNHRISSINLYLKYSEKGAKIGKGNFFKYVQRADKIFNGESGKDEWGITKKTKRHMVKIRRMLNKIEEDNSTTP